MNMMTALPRPYVATPPFRPRRSPDRFRRMVALFERDEIGEAIEALIGYLDARSPDPDIEPNGDEGDLSATFAPRSPYRPIDYCPRAGSLDEGRPSTEDDEPSDEDTGIEDAGEGAGWREGVDQRSRGGGEDSDDAEPDDDGEDASWPERDRQPGTMLGGIDQAAWHEDAEASSSEPDRRRLWSDNDA